MHLLHLLLPSLHWLSLTERRTMHQARLCPDIIECPGVQDASVVPEHGIAYPPPVAILVGRLAGVCRQLSNKPTRPVLWPANNANTHLIPKVERLAAGSGVTTHQWSHHHGIGLRLALRCRLCMVLLLQIRPQTAQRMHHPELVVGGLLIRAEGIIGCIHTGKER